MKYKVCIVGAGRIGLVHAENIAKIGGLELKYVIDFDDAAAQAMARQNDCVVADIEIALEDPEIDGVIVASATDSHADFSLRSMRAKKAVFCEKPLSLNLEEAAVVRDYTQEHNARLLVGFNRRFDPMFAELQGRVQTGAIGNVELVQITSRDPCPPPTEYARRCGGIFRDMMIHDFDVARWLVQSDPVEVCATASKNLADTLSGDFDTAVVTIRFSNGSICAISNSRHTSYGYDQRIEVHGSKGMLQVDNLTTHRVTQFNESGVTGDLPKHFFLERYADAYLAEMRHFHAMLSGAEEAKVTAVDGVKALELADAAENALLSKVRIEEEGVDRD